MLRGEARKQLFGDLYAILNHLSPKMWEDSCTRESSKSYLIRRNCFASVSLRVSLDLHYTKCQICAILSHSGAIPCCQSHIQYKNNAPERRPCACSGARRKLHMQESFSHTWLRSNCIHKDIYEREERRSRTFRLNWLLQKCTHSRTCVCEKPITLVIIYWRGRSPRRHQWQIMHTQLSAFWLCN